MLPAPAAPARDRRREGVKGRRLPRRARDGGAGRVLLSRKIYMDGNGVYRPEPCYIGARTAQRNSNPLPLHVTQIPEPLQYGHFGWSESSWVLTPVPLHCPHLPLPLMRPPAQSGQRFTAKVYNAAFRNATGRGVQERRQPLYENAVFQGLFGNCCLTTCY